MPADPSPSSAATKPASCASADTEVQEHPFEGGGPFVSTGGRLATPPIPAIAPGAPPTAHAGGATRRSSTLPSDTNRDNSTASAPPPPSPWASPSPGATSDSAAPPA